MKRNNVESDFQNSNDSENRMWKSNVHDTKEKRFFGLFLINLLWTVANKLSCKCIWHGLFIWNGGIQWNIRQKCNWCEQCKQNVFSYHSS